jgi:hypothetical protein
VEVQVAYCTFILVLFLASYCSITNKMEVEIELVSFSNFYHPSDAQLQTNEDSNHAAGELSGNNDKKPATLLPPVAISPTMLQHQSHVSQANGLLLNTL